MNILRWLSFFILVYLMLGIQLGIGAYAQFRGVAPNLLLLVVVFISLNAPRAEAMFGSFLLGMLQDLVTLQPLGMFAFSYGLVALLVSWAAEFVRPGHPLTHVCFVFAGGCVTSLVLMTHQLIHPIGPAVMHQGVMVHALRLGPRVLAVSTVYSTLLAPVILGILGRMRIFFGFQQNQRRRGRV
jgi:rod shape-determining protein MreD